MRVSIFSQFFPPEVGATQTRVHAFASGLAARGHHVDVICEIPNHPQGMVRSGFGDRPFRRVRTHGFRVIYVWVRTRPEKTTRDRIAFYGSYAAMASIAGWAMPRPDVVFASSPPLPVAAAGAVVARRHRVPWVMDVRDLWPEAAVAMGELRSPALLRLATMLEQRLYRDASAITAVTEPFRNAIADTAPAEKIHIVPNGTTPFWVQAGDIAADRQALNLPEDVFLWTFAGNIGEAQGLTTALEAAATLGAKFRLLILGDGPAKRGLLEKTRSAGWEDFILFRDQVPPERARDYLRASDAVLVSLAPDPVFQAFVPSKLFDSCAVGRPVVLAASGEAPRLADAEKAAFTVPPGDARALAEAVATLERRDDLREKLVEAGHRFASKNLRERQVTALESLLSDLVERRRE